MFVINRQGAKVPVDFNRIQNRVARLAESPTKLNVDPTLVTKNTISKLESGVKTSALDEISAFECEGLKTTHPDYSLLGGRIAASNNVKMTPDKFSECIALYPDDYFDARLKKLVKDNAAALDAMIVMDNEYMYDYIAMKSLVNSYLHKNNGIVCDRVQYMFMRVAVTIHLSEKEDSLNRVRETYLNMSNQLYTHATPTLFNAMRADLQLNSCFLLAADEIGADRKFKKSSFMESAKECSIISTSGGGIGISTQLMKHSDANSNGLIGKLKILNETAMAYGRENRPGAFAVYNEPWHPDIEKFLSMRLNQTVSESARCRNLFTGLWVPDLFMKRVNEDSDWSLFGGKEAEVLSSLYDGMDGQDKFTETYERFEREGRAVGKVKAQRIEALIFESQRDNGNPYICYKDHVNRQSNQKNIGVIKGSNLCTEIMEYFDDRSTACCTLASINVKKFYKEGAFDYNGLINIAREVTRNLNRVIDINHYPTDACEKNSRMYRPIAIGIQGLADLFAMMKISFCSPEAVALDADIAQCIYYGALGESCMLAREGGSYEGFAGSPLSRGILNQDLWDNNPRAIDVDVPKTCVGLDWDSMRLEAMKGARNSLLLGYMPTVSTAQMFGNNESFEPFSGLIYAKNTQNGRFTIVNKHLMCELIEMGLWNEDLKNRIMSEDSVQNIDGLPADFKERYKTVWELSQKELIKRAAQRQRYICQSQSLNIYLRQNMDAQLRAVMKFGWGYGLCTGSYYIRTKPALKPLSNVSKWAGKTVSAKSGEVPTCVGCSS